MDLETTTWLVRLVLAGATAVLGIALVLGSMASELRAREAVAELRERARRRKGGGAGEGKGTPVAGQVDPAVRRLHAIVDWILADELRRGR